MKVLLDENVDVRFRFSFEGTGHEVFTVKFMGWNGIKNGKLLQLMAEHNFDLLIGVDKSMPYQQNEMTLPVSIVVLDIGRNVLSNLKAYVPLLLSYLEQPLRKEMITLSLPRQES
jgi:hypothetical protein